MIKMIDNTLTTLDGCLPTKEQLHEFCKLLLRTGIDYIEMSEKVYERMEQLPSQGQYILHVKNEWEVPRFSGFTRYVCRHAKNAPKVMSEFQMNDIREIVQLKNYAKLDYVRLVGLDDLMCYSYLNEMNECKRILRRSRINFCPENTYGCASALAVQWLINGGGEVTTSFCGHGNKAATEEVIMALRLTVRYKPNYDLCVLQEMKSLFEQMTGQKIYARKPIIGEDIYTIEAGIHADGIAKNPATYETYDPAIVGAKTRLVLGKHSGRNAIKMKLIENAIPIPREKTVLHILREVQKYAVQTKNSLENEAFVTLVKEVIAYERKKIHR